MALIKMTFPDHLYEFTGNGYYADNLPLEVREWLNSRVGKVVYRSDVRFANNVDHITNEWMVVRGGDTYWIYLWTDELTAVEFKLKWL